MHGDRWVCERVPWSGRYMKLRSEDESEEIDSECRLSLHGRLVVVPSSSIWDVVGE